MSILKQFSKILEKVYNKRLVDFIESNKILCDSQFGFRSNHSTSLALMETVENITSSIDNGQYTAGIFIDLTKAFDIIDHAILIAETLWYEVLRYHGLKVTCLIEINIYILQ